MFFKKRTYYVTYTKSFMFRHRGAIIRELLKQANLPINRWLAIYIYYVYMSRRIGYHKVHLLDNVLIIETCTYEQHKMFNSFFV